MLKIFCLSVTAGVIALTAAMPVVGTHWPVLGETRAMLLTATAFFGLASAMRWRGKGSQRRGPLR